MLAFKFMRYDILVDLVEKVCLCVFYVCGLINTKVWYMCH